MKTFSFCTQHLTARCLFTGRKPNKRQSCLREENQTNVNLVYGKKTKQTSILFTGRKPNKRQSCLREENQTNVNLVYGKKTKQTSILFTGRKPNKRQSCLREENQTNVNLVYGRKTKQTSILFTGRKPNKRQSSAQTSVERQLKLCDRVKPVLETADYKLCGKKRKEKSYKIQRQLTSR